MDCRGFVRTACGLVVLVSAQISCVAFGRAVDDAVFNLSLRGDLNGNGVIDPDEIGNALDCSAVSPVRVDVRPHAGTDPAVSNCVFATPMHPMTTNSWPVLAIPQDVRLAEDGALQVACNCIDFPGGAAYEGTTQTMYARFRWDGNAVTNYDSNCWLMLNGFDWFFCGWGVYICQTEGNTTDGTVGVMIPQRVSRVGGTVKRGLWYDLFVTVRPYNETRSIAIVNLMAVPDTKIVTDEENRLAFNSPEFMHYELQNADYPYPILAFPHATRKTVLRLGAEENSLNDWTSITGANNNAAKTFNGAIARFMLWTRELDQSEMWDVASGHDGAVWSVGAVNGSADEFASAGADDVHLVTNDWRTMRKALTEAQPVLTLKGPLSAAEAGFGHIVSLTPLFGAQAPWRCPVRIDVNGAEVGVFDLTQSRGRNAYVPGKFWTRDAEGCATVTFTRLAPFASDLEIDAVTLAGSWGIGLVDGRNGEFERENCTAKVFVAGDMTAKHAMRANLGPTTTYTNIVFRLYVPPEAAGRHDAYFETKVTDMADQAKLSGHAVVGLAVNGVPVETRTDVAYGAELRFEIPAGTLRAGMNTVELLNGTSREIYSAVGGGGSWICFDYYRLVALPEKNGTMLFLR